MTAKASVVCALSAFAAGCAAPGASLTAVPAHVASDAVVIGKSTKADVIAAFGKTRGISFDSGFEVWVYQVTGNAPVIPGWRKPGMTEYVLLFAPSGLVTKTRIRPSPPSSATVP